MHTHHLTLAALSHVHCTAHRRLVCLKGFARTCSIRSGIRPGARMLRHRARYTVRQIALLCAAGSWHRVVRTLLRPSIRHEIDGVQPCGRCRFHHRHRRRRQQLPCRHAWVLLCMRCLAMQCTGVFSLRRSSARTQGICARFEFTHHVEVIARSAPPTPAQSCSRAPSLLPAVLALLRSSLALPVQERPSQPVDAPHTQAQSRLRAPRAHDWLSA